MVGEEIHFIPSKHTQTYYIASKLTISLLTVTESHTFTTSVELELCFPQCGQRCFVVT